MSAGSDRGKEEDRSQGLVPVLRALVRMQVGLGGM